ncbi:hypothetical protein DFH01_06345 [Falsiroseomonas bella]|uniref:Integral membrane protein n=1 Tax=Falsiroseomonas bella TaxID=2184016 RepID=A0A317FJQ3_9PROT|nr:hypothetical protein [Falsiroseomonas bella]PWS38863.1 hypothetical protein DFH01_06345 [Falsiroseomonas bella]
MDATIAGRPRALTPAPLLRFALRLDAAASGVLALLMLLGAPLLADPLGLPEGLLRGAGLVCLPYAAVLAWMTGRPSLPAWAVWSVIGLNAVWTADSLLLLASGWVAPTALGTAFVLAQAAAVGGFALLQWRGLARSRA